MNKPIPFQTLQQVALLKGKHSRRDVTKITGLSERQVKLSGQVSRVDEKNTAKSFHKVPRKSKNFSENTKRRPRDLLMTGLLMINCKNWPNFGTLTKSLSTLKTLTIGISPITLWTARLQLYFWVTYIGGALTAIGKCCLIF